MQQIESKIEIRRKNSRDFCLHSPFLQIMNPSPHQYSLARIGNPWGLGWLPLVKKPPSSLFSFSSIRPFLSFSCHCTLSLPFPSSPVPFHHTFITIIPSRIFNRFDTTFLNIKYLVSGTYRKPNRPRTRDRPRGTPIHPNSPHDC